MSDRYQMHIGDALTVLRGLPAESVQCCITSPPYWGLRDYGVSGQIGLEGSPDEHVARLVEVFGEVRRVLRADGTLWLNYGDAYHHVTGGYNPTAPSNQPGHYDGDERGNAGSRYEARHERGLSGRQYVGAIHGLKPKDLIGLPWMLAFALRADGWWLRSDIIWHKPNPMPESVTDRPTNAHEHLFLLAKSTAYFYDAEAIRENSIGTNGHDLTGPGYSAPGQTPQNGNRNGSKQDALGKATYTGFNARWDAAPVAGRNRRNVWTIPTAQFNDWEETYRLVRVAWDGASDGMMRIGSPDCPHHAGQPDRVPTAYRDERSVGELTRILCIDPDRARALLAGRGPSELRRELRTSLESSGLLAQQCAEPAIGHSKQSRRTDPVPSTNPACTASARTPVHTGGTLEGLDLGGLAEHNRESSNAEDCASDEQGSGPWGQTVAHTGGKCTCSWFLHDTRKTSHFATFPPDLVKPCVLAGTSERGACPACGAPWARVVEKSGGTTGHSWHDHQDDGMRGQRAYGTQDGTYRREHKGWTPTCSCDRADTVPCVVLDPFAGSGTTGAVALQYGRRFVGIELNAEYAAMAERRLAAPAAQLLLETLL